MMKVTNNGTATRGVHVGGVVKFIRPGEARELALTGFELNDAKATDGLTIEAAEPAQAVTKPKQTTKTEEKSAETGKTEEKSAATGTT